MTDLLCDGHNSQQQLHIMLDLSSNLLSNYLPLGLTIHLNSSHLHCINRCINNILLI
jgi:hypothetical protein